VVNSHRKQQQPNKMTSHRDLENNSMPDERAPLLAPERAEGATTVSPDDDDAAPKPQSEASKRRAYGWRGFWIVVAILIIAVFVKGWIESDDVEVSIP
jgi:hypothetical protein